MTDKREERAARFAAEHRAVLERLRSIDYASLERRVLAAAGAGKDPHVEAASELFQIDTAVVTAEQRKAGKAINFGILYNVRRVCEGDFEGIARLVDESYSTYTGRTPRKPKAQHV